MSAPPIDEPLLAPSGVDHAGLQHALIQTPVGARPPRPESTITLLVDAHGSVALTRFRCHSRSAAGVHDRKQTLEHGDAVLANASAADGNLETRP